jgi:hypothetical protein
MTNLGRQNVVSYDTMAEDALKQANAATALWAAQYEDASK